jgi:uncharacterized protein (DUF1330 family)
MTAYWIGEHAITDPATFDEYLRQVIPMIERFAGRYLTRGGAHRVLDGDWHPNRVVIVEFPTWRPYAHSTLHRNTSGSLRFAEAPHAM